MANAVVMTHGVAVVVGRGLVEGQGTTSDGMSHFALPF